MWICKIRKTRDYFEYPIRMELFSSEASVGFISSSLWNFHRPLEKLHSITSNCRLGVGMVPKRPSIRKRNRKGKSGGEKLYTQFETGNILPWLQRSFTLLYLKKESSFSQTFAQQVDDSRIIPNRTLIVNEKCHLILVYCHHSPRYVSPPLTNQTSSFTFRQIDNSRLSIYSPLRLYVF